MSKAWDKSQAPTAPLPQAGDAGKVIEVGEDETSYNLAELDTSEAFYLKMIGE